MNPLVTTKLAPESGYQPTRHSLSPLQLSEIPTAMDRMGWATAARLMRRWFGNPPYAMSNAVRAGKTSPLELSQEYYDDHIVTMDWALHYPRCSSAHDRLMLNWANPNGVDRLTKLLKKQGWHPGLSTPVMLGYDMQTGQAYTTARALHANCQTNLSLFGARSDVLDDMYGALGTAVCYLAAVGHTALSSGGRDIFVVDRLGCYIRDTYDFTDGGLVPEPLGVRSRDRCLTKAETMEFMALLSSRGDSLFRLRARLQRRLSTLAGSTKFRGGLSGVFRRSMASARYSRDTALNAV
jgi:hypothetical protein